MISDLKKDARFFKKKLSDTSQTMSLSNYVYALLSPEFRVVMNYRIYSFLFKLGYYNLATLLYLRCKRIYGTDIHPESDIGVPLKIGHHSGIVIGPKVVLGKYNYIMNSVTIGNKEVGGIDQMPRIGNWNIIGVGARVLGGVSIGNRNTIGANSVVINSFGDNALIIGSPATNRKVE